MTVTLLAPDPTDSVLPLVVESWAEREPDRAFLQQVDGPALTYGEAHEAALRWADAFRRLGVGEGDRVVAMHTPSIDGVVMWLGLGWLGAIDTSVNTDYRGAMLDYVLGNAGPKVLVVQERFLSRLGEVSASLDPSTVVVVPDTDAPASALPCRVIGREAALKGTNPDPAPFRPSPWTTSCVIYTSGTTGPSKGVLVPWAQIHATATGCFPTEDLAGDEAFYSPFATFHMSGKLPPVIAGTCGGRLVVREQLSPTAFWEDIRKYSCTLAITGGPLLDQLLAIPPHAADPAFPLRQSVLASAPPSAQEFSRRFGVRLRTSFNMTEISVPIVSGTELSEPASCGRLRMGYPGYEVRIVDENDYEVPVGTVGELVVRTSVPWTLNSGYLAYPEKTAHAWRNGWFHTGDAMRIDQAGNYYFVDRLQDAIRRKGENISSFEVEAAVLSHPDVAECAAVAVTDEAAGQEVKVCVLLRSGSVLSEGALIEYLIPRMPRFMVPRYVEFVDDFSRTEASGKIRKAALRENPLTPSTWDRLREGVAIPRLP